jgi:hypothetical protein
MCAAPRFPREGPITGIGVARCRGSRLRFEGALPWVGFRLAEITACSRKERREAEKLSLESDRDADECADARVAASLILEAAEVIALRSFFTGAKAQRPLPFEVGGGGKGESHIDRMLCAPRRFGDGGGPPPPPTFQWTPLRAA